MIVYDRFWKTLECKGLNQYKLIHDYKISPSLITRIKRNEGINVNTINVLCEILDCKVEDIMEYVSDVQEDKKGEQC